ncbi:MAG: hypothetical protein GXZ01_09730 [Clostridiaceae bacterium]|nr:hypothetical protein [Clostridiaceae bacterium]
MDYREALEATRRSGRCDRDRDRDRDRDEDRVLDVARNVCPQKKGTILRIFIPAGAEINLLNLLEISSPGGICIIIRLPFLKKLFSCKDISDLFEEIKRAGGRIEFVD